MSDKATTGSLAAELRQLSAQALTPGGQHGHCTGSAEKSVFTSQVCFLTAGLTSMRWSPKSP